MLLKLKSYSRKGYKRVNLKSIAYFSVELNRKGRALFTFVYISIWSRRTFILNSFKNIWVFFMYFNENSTKEFMCNTQYRSSYNNGIAFLWKSTMCCELVAFMFLTSKLVFIWTWSWGRNLPIYFDLLFFELNI